MPEKDYWNHNTAYHRRLLGIAAEHPGDVLDVGCGEGLLARRLARVSRTVTAIDPDAAAVRRARARVAALPNVTVAEASFTSFDPGPQRFGLITFVATLHHMDLRASLTKARDLLTPGGTLAVVGVAANRTVGDWIADGLRMPFARVAGVLHGETRDIGVVVAEPRESLSEIRRTATQILPGVSIRRGVYYRYLLRWRNV
ncbi:SAM-dependent methyltransferase [Mycolicibacterium canariasense]|uniref:SAM-dependent methyltransferase n=1 Tax=Mycolicibacterium canariasense TaxID=228230 RepID=A0A100WF36_MYCCR|nr:class I SAM-dependent methyltransferase [Mycolicibacterium canariasense]MCV7211578.1 class I SAM-dependent methyltransferase [Mycolicibacterium canariasense]ORV00379.1 SAM-dependent methyltransferase [Mycolicibacterium canariasense]GAS97015.1 SAM-dependent methyltransferase [Mycolicibacterium canariasense]